MGRAKYKATPITSLDFGAVSAKVGTVCVLGIDVAKRVQFVSFGGHDGRSLGIFKWSYPDQADRFVRLCQRLFEDGIRVEAVLEPSGTYSTAIRYLLTRAKVATFCITGKRVHDAREVYDGVPSSHDAKSATLLVWLHSQDVSKPWKVESEERRALAAATSALNRHVKELGANLSRLESRMSLHWPELEMCVDLDRVSVLKLLHKYGSPQRVAQNLDPARELMTEVGGHFLKSGKITSVLDSASTTQGLPMIAAEVEALMDLARDVLAARGRLNVARRKVEVLSDRHVPEPMRAMLGKVTAGVLVGLGLDPRNSHCPKSYKKALGLNLRETSSGTKRGRVQITKRGNSSARRWLFFAALRLVQKDPVVKAWHERMKARNGQKGIKAVVAVMRKLALALWHVARGDRFDAQLLFDVQMPEVQKLVIERT